MSKKVYKKQSNIPNAGFGLFAGEDIKKGSLITEFTGLKTAKPTDTWSVIYFYGDKHIQCGKSNLASYANDVILFPTKRRDFVELVNNNEELYQSYNNQSPNSQIYQNDKLLRAWLKAERDIKKDEEIFVHYGLQFWFKTEMQLKEDTDTDETRVGIHQNLFRTESFKKYVNKFYPTVIEIEPETINGMEVVKLKTDNLGGGFIMDMGMFL
jgi:SET domain-containing protein